jgi:hypothetical protein
VAQVVPPSGDVSIENITFVVIAVMSATSSRSSIDCAMPSPLRSICCVVTLVRVVRGATVFFSPSAIAPSEDRKNERGSGDRERLL